MRAMTITTYIAALVLVGCSEDREPTPSDPTPPGGPPAAILSQTAAISECGGFAASEAPSQGTLGPADYCAAEVLEWSFDAASGTLKLANNRVTLNCCGDHSIAISEQGDTFVITETDAPQGGGGRCRCMCVFDFTTAVQLAPSVRGKIKIALVREVTDDGQGAQQLYSGTLDLDAASGTAIVDESDASPWCDGGSSAPPADPVEQPVRHSDEISECGGFAPVSNAPEPPSFAGGYCDAELLKWSYDAASERLTLLNTRALLNCCGERTIEVTKRSDGSYGIVEHDAPEAGGGRCNCMCVFDFSTTIEGVSGTSVALDLVRQVQDAGSATAGQLFAGTLDLTQGEGAEILDTADVAPWCE